MEDEKIIKYIKETPETKNDITILASINILIQAMIKKGWFTEQEYNDALEITIDKMIKEYLKQLTEEQRKSLEAHIRISEDDLFGSLFKNFM